MSVTSTLGGFDVPALLGTIPGQVFGQVIGHESGHGVEQAVADASGTFSLTWLLIAFPLLGAAILLDGRAHV